MSIKNGYFNSTYLYRFAPEKKLKPVLVKSEPMGKTAFEPDAHDKSNIIKTPVKKTKLVEDKITIDAPKNWKDTDIEHNRFNTDPYKQWQISINIILQKMKFHLTFQGLCLFQVIEYFKIQKKG